MKTYKLLWLSVVLLCSAGCVTMTEKERAQIKEELKKEILNEIKAGDVTKDIQKPSYTEPIKTPPLSVARNEEVASGTAEGFMLDKGKGLEDCKVRLVRMVESDSILHAFKEFQKGAEFETVTDKDGKYIFKDIPIGSYRLTWQTKGETGWIRRLTDKPDVIVMPDKVVRIKDTEINKPLVPR